MWSERPTDIWVTIDRKGLPDCLGVELVVSQVIDGQQQPYVVTEMNQVKTDGDLVTYALSYDVNVGRHLQVCVTRLLPEKSRSASSSGFLVRTLVLIPYVGKLSVHI